MSVWIAVPSKRPVAEAQAFVAKWRSMGYLVALRRDTGDALVDCDYIQFGDYPGYAKSVNSLAKDVLAYDAACDWIVAGGDDTSPDPNKHADLIAAECSAYFWENYCVGMSLCGPRGMDRYDYGRKTFGVMQPTGDGHGIDTIAGSPWMGREWCLRAHRGAGPMHPDFFHMHVDNALKEAAERLGVYWKRPDLAQHHDHWTRTGRSMPEFMRLANSRQQWWQGEQILARLRRDGFSECLPV
jgi:hypothetical protein